MLADPTGRRLSETRDARRGSSPNPPVPGTGKVLAWISIINNMM